ncbi:MAG TPA: GntR family transcriptional regulator [Solirubrobacteraceae bacterium]|nr:GntR family transcriptional regulator [Solirubrobacteraceae bacterium]
MAPTRARLLLRDEVYHHLRDLIITGGLEPGMQLRDTEIANELGVSRTPVREALRRLEDEGLVEMVASRWTRVSPLDLTESERLYPIMWTLENLAISLTTLPIAPETLAQLHEANDRLREALMAHNSVAASQADADFHEVIARASGNDELLRLIRDLKNRVRRFEIFYFGSQVLAERSHEEHVSMIEALEAGDLNAAARISEQNWRGSLERLRSRTRSGARRPCRLPAE